MASFYDYVARGVKKKRLPQERTLYLGLTGMGGETVPLLQLCREIFLKYLWAQSWGESACQTDLAT